MKVPYRLRRRARPEPATALLLPAHDPADVLRLCERLGCDPLPAVYAVADGFLLKLAQPAPGAVAGCVRLRGLSAHLLLPVDADLEPALLPDEAAALVRDRGLVFLPGGRVLEFAPGRPLPPAALLGAPVRRADWQPLPRPRPLADRITEVVVESPPEEADEVLDAGGEGIGTEAPRPPDAGLPSKALGKATLGLGKGLAWLGHKLGLGGLTGLGAGLIAKALSLAPRLAESLMGRQEASLRELLRDFQEGNLERALRRAVALGGDSARGAGLHGGDRLPSRDPSYSLWDILRGHGGGGGLFYSSAETYQKLEREYRRAAAEAARAGDHRRAAFIYGKLLGDYRRAAAVLAEGGLHRDAALIYLHKLSDPLAAAREYEAGGDIDRALRLYRQVGAHDLAGDLLRKAGEEELAVAEYVLAAAKIAWNDGQYKAGEFLLNRARRPDLALEYYQEGWKRRPNGSPVPCAVRLTQIHTQQEAVGRVLELVGEAEQYLRPEGNDAPAAEFFNEVARLAGQTALARARDELRDRALLGLAGKMRQRVAARTAAGGVSGMMGAATVWAPAVVSDADFAVKRAITRGPVLSARAKRAASTLIRARVPVVTAVCWAPGSGAIVLGFESGEVVLFKPLLGEVLPISREDHAVLSLAVSPDGNTLVVLSGSDGAGTFLAGYARSVGYRMTSMQPVQTSSAPEDLLLVPLLVGGAAPLAGVWDWGDLHFLRMPQLLPEGQWMAMHTDFVPGAALLLPSSSCPPGDQQVLNFLLLAGTRIGHARGLVMTSKCLLDWKALGWRLTLPAGSTLRRPPLAWLPAGPDAFEVAAVGPEGMLCWARVTLLYGMLGEVSRVTMSLASPCLAVTLVKPGLLAAVTARAVHWFRVVGHGFAQTAEWPEAFPEAVACFPHQRGDELIVVGADGTVARVPSPRL
jgi:tetratricopeptide (TPR) repeat protein